MTMFLRRLKKCGCCGEETPVSDFCSTNTSGSCDLDARPAEMQRSAIFRGMQFCRNCGYAAWDLEEKIRPSKALRKILSEKIDARDMVELFERAAGIAALKGGKKEAIEYLHLIAAWAADDKKDVATAVSLRKKILSGVSPDDAAAPARLLRLIDVARRAGEKDAALALLKRLDECEIAPPSQSEEIVYLDGKPLTMRVVKEDEIDPSLVKRIAAFQRKLLENDDTACYTLDDVP